MFKRKKKQPEDNYITMDQKQFESMIAGFKKISDTTDKMAREVNKLTAAVKQNNRNKP